MNAPAGITTAPRLAKLRAEDFWLLAESGAFDNYARSELIEGEIWVVNALHRWHGRMVFQLAFAIEEALRRIASPLVLYDATNAALAADLVTQPDIAIAQPGLDGPIPLADMKLAAEIADTSQRDDLVRKAQLYARHGVAEYWVVSRSDNCIYQHWQPTGAGYAEHDKVTLGETIFAKTIDRLSLRTPILI